MNDSLTMAGSLITTILIICVVIYLRTKGGSKTKDLRRAEAATSTDSAIGAADSDQSDMIAIPLERLPAIREIDEKSLVEITDRTVVARISQAFPALAETATRTMANNALRSMEVYRAILPNGETLAKSKGMEGAMRGFSRGARGQIQSHAELVRVDLKDNCIS